MSALSRRGRVFHNIYSCYARVSRGHSDPGGGRGARRPRTPPSPPPSPMRACGVPKKCDDASFGRSFWKCGRKPPERPPSRCHRPFALVPWRLHRNLCASGVALDRERGRWRGYVPIDPISGGILPRAPPENRRGRILLRDAAAPLPHRAHRPFPVSPGPSPPTPAFCSEDQGLRAP